MVQLIELLENRSVAKLLVFFIRQPTLQIHQQNIRKKTKISKVTLIKWLNFLVENKILNLLKFGRTKVYSLNRENTVVKQLKLLDNILLLSGVGELAVKHNVKVFLYGSSARGEDVETSDVDVLIIGKIKVEDIIKDIKKISEEIKMEINIKVFSPMQFAELSRTDRPFYERFEKDKIELK